MKIYNTPEEVLNAMNEKFKDAGLEQYTLQEAIKAWGIDEPGIDEEQVTKWVNFEIYVFNELI